MRRLAMVAALALGACGFGGPESATTTTTTPAEAVSYVAIGGEETVGGDLERGRGVGFARILFRDHLPPQAVFTVVATPGPSVADVLIAQVDGTLEIGATVVTIWIDEATVRADRSGTDAASALADALTRLTEAGVEVAVTTGPVVGPSWTRTARTIVDDAGAVFVDLAGETDERPIAERFATALDLGG